MNLLYSSFYNKSGTSERALGDRHEQVYNTSTARSQQFAPQIEAAEFEREWRDGTDNDVRYIGVFIESASCFRCSLDNKKGKVFPYSLPSVGPGADPGVQAVSPQVT